MRGGLRVLALVLLTALSLFIVFSPAAQALRNAVFDGYQRLFPLQRSSTPVTVVLIDENSIARFGPWPWPRTRVADMIELIARGEPAAIGLDLIFPEPDRFSPGAVAAEHPVIPPEVAKVLEALPSNDERFAAAMRGKPVVLGISAETQPDPRYVGAPRAEPILKRPEGVLDSVAKYPGHIGNIPIIDDAAAGRGVLNSGQLDQVVRQVPFVVNVQGTPVPSLGVETLRVAAGSGLRVDHAAGGALRMRFDGVQAFMQRDGHAWLRFSPHNREQSVPAAGLFAGDFKPELLKQKIVLVGVSGLGLDYKTTPLGEFIPGVFVHAQVVENLFNGVSLTRPDYAPWIEAAALLACGVILIAMIPRLTALQGINLAAGLAALLIGAGVIAFLYFDTLFDPAWPAIGTAAMFGSVVVGTLSETEKQRRLLREQAARIAGEVDAARRIQMGLLPDPHLTLANDRRFEIAALLEPARTVGGDFYDCFMVDARRLFFIVADVSGKGLPAALFMASAKSHFKSAALAERDVGSVLTRAQDEIMRENPEQLFVTAFAGALDVETGVLEYANAGHEPPFLRKPQGPERFEPPGGPPICVVEDFAYAAARRQLVPGEWLCVVTDGATEAMNPAREFFGVERLRGSLSWTPEDARPDEIIRRVREDVMRFVAEAEPADDLTLVALRWSGATLR